MKTIIEQTSRSGRNSIGTNGAALLKSNTMWQGMVVAGAISAARLAGASMRAQGRGVTSIVGPGSLSGLTPTAGSSRAPEAIGKNMGQVIITIL